MHKLEIIDYNNESIKEFASQMHSLHNIFIVYLADWCGHCKHFKPEWDKIKTALKNGAAGNATGYIVTSNDKTMKHLPPEVKRPSGYPTMSLYKGHKWITDYNGGRNKDDIIKFIKKHMKKQNKRHVGGLRRKKKTRKTKRRKTKRRKTKRR